MTERLLSVSRLSISFSLSSKIGFILSMANEPTLVIGHSNCKENSLLPLKTQAQGFPKKVFNASHDI